MFVCEVKSLHVAVVAPARPSGRDVVMASPPLPRRWWLLEGTGATANLNPLLAQTLDACPLAQLGSIFGSHQLIKPQKLYAEGNITQISHKYHTNVTDKYIRPFGLVRKNNKPLISVAQPFK
jgi:hypothetical protein